jgi:Tfp pilus assembly protein PilF
MRDYEVAEAELQNVLKIDPAFRNARERLTKVRYMRGVPYFLENAALDVYLQKQNKSAGLDYLFRTDELERLISNGDEKALAERYVKIALESVKEKPESYLGLSKYFAITGEKEKSLTALEKAYEAKSFVIPFVGVDPLWDPVRDDVRFKEIVRRMNL